MTEEKRKASVRMGLTYKDGWATALVFAAVALGIACLLHDEPTSPTRTREVTAAVFAMGVAASFVGG